jgi:hypothetical protein
MRSQTGKNLVIGTMHPVELAEIRTGEIGQLRGAHMIHRFDPGEFLVEIGRVAMHMADEFKLCRPGTCDKKFSALLKLVFDLLRKIAIQGGLSRSHRAGLVMNMTVPVRIGLDVDRDRIGLIAENDMGSFMVDPKYAMRSMHDDLLLTNVIERGAMLREDPAP